MRLSCLTAAAMTAILATTAAVAEAGTLYIGSGTSNPGNGSDSYTISGSVDVTFDADADTVTFVLTNLTPFTYSSAELLTAFRFDLTGVTGAGDLSSAEAYARDVDSDGEYVDSLALEDLLGPPATWQLGTLGGLFDLKFNPNAEYALIGTADSDDDYSGSNGGIKDNNGHSPFAALTATFILSFDDVTESAAITDLNFRFGTDFEGSVTPTLVPLPPAVLLGLGLMGGIGAVRAIRRRRRPEF